MPAFSWRWPLFRELIRLWSPACRYCLGYLSLDHLLSWLRGASVAKTAGSTLAPAVPGFAPQVAEIRGEPVRVLLPAYDHRADSLRLGEARDRGLGRQLEVGGERLYAIGRLGLDVIDDELVVPVERGRDARMLVEPLRQFFLGIEAFALRQCARGDRLEQQREVAARRRRESGHQVEELLAPGLLAHFEQVAEGASAENADHALARLEAVLHVERLPGAALLVLGVAHARVIERITLRPEVGGARHGA